MELRTGGRMLARRRAALGMRCRIVAWKRAGGDSLLARTRVSTDLVPSRMPETKLIP